jgi:uncharacterized protein YcbK (DUF882 family)
LLSILSLKVSAYSCNLNFFNKTYATCELKDVKFNWKSNFEVEIDFNQTVNQDYEENDVSGPETDRNEVEQVFKDSIKRVDFKRSKLSNIPNEIFMTFKQLEILDASNTHLTHLNSLSLNKAENLLEIHLQNNQLKTINGWVFVHTKKLEILDLSFNQIEKIELFAFNNLESLLRLDLSNNKIENIDDDTFEPLKSLQSLWLDRNRIKVISSQLFSKTNLKLQSISANHNRITDFSPYVFDKLKNLRYLFLNGNECVDKCFVNHAIAENVAIKMELRKCFKNYLETFPKESEKFNITIALGNAKAGNEKCEADRQDLEESIKKNEMDIEELEKKTRN